MGTTVDIDYTRRGFAKRMEEIKKRYMNGDVFGAMECILKIDLSDQDEHGIINEIKKESIEVENVLKDFKKDDGWKCSHKSKECNVNGYTDSLECFYRHEEGSDLYSIKLRGTIDSCDLSTVFSLINETDLYKDWWPNQLKEASDIICFSICRRIIYISVSSPWPFDDRDLVLYGNVVDLLDEYGEILILTRSCPEDISQKKFLFSPLEDTQDIPFIIPEPPPGTTRAVARLGGILLSLPSDEHSPLTVTMLSNVDPRLSFAPYWLVNMVASRLSPLFFRLFSRACRSQDSPWEQRVAEKPHIYSWALEKVHSHFLKQQNTRNSPEKDGVHPKDVHSYL